jgi:hypothetical protein
LEDVLVDLYFEAFGEDVDAVMLEDETAEEVVVGLWFLGFADDVVEDEVDIPATDLIEGVGDFEHVEPFSEVALPGEVLVGGDFDVEYQEDVDLVDELADLL